MRWFNWFIKRFEDASPFFRSLVSYVVDKFTAIANFLFAREWRIWALLGIGLVLVLASPDTFYKATGISASCREIVDKTDGFGSLGGSNIRLAGSRDCEDASVIAVEVFSPSEKKVLGPNQQYANQPSIYGELFLDGSSLERGIEGSWYQRSLFAKVDEPTQQNLGNSFIYSEKGARQYILNSRSCEHSPESDLKYRMFSSGISIFSGHRSHRPLMSEAEWRYCNEGEPDKLGYEACKYVKYEIFLPISELSKYCGRVGLAARWLSPTVRTIDLLPSKRMQQLEESVHLSWHGPIGPQSTFPLDYFSRLIGDAPLVCARYVELDGTPITGEPWRPIGRAARLYCDR